MLQPAEPHGQGPAECFTAVASADGGGGTDRPYASASSLGSVTDATPSALTLTACETGVKAAARLAFPFTCPSLHSRQTLRRAGPGSPESSLRPSLPHGFAAWSQQPSSPLSCL